MAAIKSCKIKVSKQTLFLQFFLEPALPEAAGNLLVYVSKILLFYAQVQILLCHGDDGSRG